MSRCKNNHRCGAEQVALEREIATSSRDQFLDVLIGACAMIACADGRVDVRERRRVLQLIRTLPASIGFSNDFVAREFSQYECAFAEAPLLARTKVLVAIEALEPHASKVRMLLSACQQVLEADGIYDPREYQALSDLSKALRAG